MGLEARALTAAMLMLKAAGVVALPVHDSLIVPQEAVSMAEQALMGCFRQQVGITPRLHIRLGAIGMSGTRVADVDQASLRNTASAR